MTKVRGSFIESNFLFLGSFLGLIVLIFYPPFFRGLFFQPEQQWALIFASLLFVITWFWKLSCREASFLKKPVDYLVVALVLSYGISFFAAANPRLALAEVIKYAIYFLVFWLCSQLVRNHKDVKILLHAIYLAGIGVALAGVMCATGLIYIKDGFLYGRIFSTMQYPNALASYLAALSFIGIYLWLQFWKTDEGSEFGKKAIPGFLYAIGNYILLLIYIGTGSRGGLIVYPLVLLVYFIGLGKEYRYLAFGHFTLTFIAAMAANIKLMPMLVAGNAGGAWLWFFIGVLAAVIGQALILALSRLKISKQVIGAAAGIIVIAILIFGWMQVKDTDVSSKLMPSHLISSIRNINLADRNVQERFVFWQDAFKIVKDHPVFGFGGGAFEETYRKYQSYFYSSTQVHNHYMQLWAEVGTVGLIIFLSIWLFYKLMVFKLWWKQKDRETKLLVWSIYGTAATIGLHAFLDFDLSLSAITIVLFAMLGLTRGMERYTFNEYKYMDYQKFAQWKWVYQGAVIGVSALVIIFVSMLNMGISESQAGSKAFTAKDYAQAKSHFEKAVSYDRFNPDYRSSLAVAYLNLNEQEEAIKTIEQAVAIAPYNVNVLGTAVNVYAESGNLDQVLKYSEKTVESFPYNYALWEGLTYRYFVVGYQAWAKGDREQAAKMLKKAQEVPGRVEKQMAGVTEQYKSMWGTQLLPVLEVTPSMKLYEGASQYILHDWTNAEQNLKFAFEHLQDKQLKGEAAMWLGVLYQKQGNKIQTAVISAAGSQLMDKFEANVRGLAELETLQ
ncbi:O-antigen ligase family protein [Candidatus Formimonas warabiya]|uniref:O-antigen ligase-related domain-containing protein n=1 Tax=Formimonas warabiya TaxID=1761012 RepID=A0A3G1KZS3_FORW1|nr:O-antigen ligase family protein [Candidatus Formimonas warabiya]ATW27735.1 hypothetical protein DCMF_25930 [Candidatus Formimonas warabiya]